MNTHDSNRRLVCQGLLGLGTALSPFSAWSQTQAKKPIPKGSEIPTTAPQLLADPIPGAKAEVNTSVSLLDAESLLDWQPLKLPPYGNILCLGDEITKGETNDNYVAYPMALKKILGGKREVFNAGYRNATTLSVLSRAQDSIPNRRPTVVIIGTGRGDRTRGLDIFQLQDNIGQIIHLAHSYGARVLLLALPYSTGKREDPHEAIASQKGFVDPANPNGVASKPKRVLTEEEMFRDRLLVDKLYVDIAREHKIAVDLYSVSYAIAQPENTYPSGLPNKKGNEVMAQYVAEALKRYSMTPEEVEALTEAHRQRAEQAR